MRSQLRLSLILAAAIFPTAVMAAGQPTQKTPPKAQEKAAEKTAEVSAEDEALDQALGFDGEPATVATAKGPAADAPAQVQKSKARLLSAEEVSRYFVGFEATLASDGTVQYFGSTSAHCLGLIELRSASVEQGVKTGFYYNGADDSCKDGSESVKADGEGRLSQKDGASIKMDKSGGVFLESENLNSDRERYSLVAMKGKNDEELKFLTAKDKALAKKALEEKNRAEGIKEGIEIVTTCQNGLDQLGYAQKTLDDLFKLDEVVEGQGKEWFAKVQDDLNAKVFKACKLQIEKAKSSEIGLCDEQLAKLVATDPEYKAKVANLYLAMIGRYMNSSNLSVTDAYAKATAVIEKLRDANLGLSDDEMKNVDKMEKQLQMAALEKASQFGSESDAFKEIMASVKEKAMDSEEMAGCLDDKAQFLVTQRANPKCGTALQFSLTMQKMQFDANKNQMQIAFAAKQAEQQARDAMLSQSCQMDEMYAKSTGAAYQASAQCAQLSARLKAQADAQQAQAAAAANENITGSGFGTALTTPAANTQNLYAPASTTTAPQNGMTTQPNSAANVNTGSVQNGMITGVQTTAANNPLQGRRN